MSVATFNNTKKSRVGKKKSKVWTDDEKRFVLKNSEDMPIDELASHLGRTIDQIKYICGRIGVGYFSRKKAA